MSHHPYSGAASYIYANEYRTPTKAEYGGTFDPYDGFPQTKSYNYDKYPGAPNHQLEIDLRVKRPNASDLSLDHTQRTAGLAQRTRGAFKASGRQAVTSPPTATLGFSPSSQASSLPSTTSRTSYPTFSRTHSRTHSNQQSGAHSRNGSGQQQTHDQSNRTANHRNQTHTPAVTVHTQAPSQSDSYNASVAVFNTSDDPFAYPHHNSDHHPTTPGNPKSKSKPRLKLKTKFKLTLPNPFRFVFRFGSSSNSPLWPPPHSPSLTPVSHSHSRSHSRRRKPTTTTINTNQSTVYPERSTVHDRAFDDEEDDPSSSNWRWSGSITQESKSVLSRWLSVSTIKSRTSSFKSKSSSVKKIQSSTNLRVNTLPPVVESHTQLPTTANGSSGNTTIGQSSRSHYGSPIHTRPLPKLPIQSGPPASRSSPATTNQNHTTTRSTDANGSNVSLVGAGDNTGTVESPITDVGGGAEKRDKSLRFAQVPQALGSRIGAGRRAEKDLTFSMVAGQFSAETAGV